MMKRMRGVTALDLVITLAIATLLVTAGVPALREYGASQRMKAAVTALQSDLQYARTEAIARAARLVACPGQPPGDCDTAAHWHQGWMVFVDEDGDFARQPDEPLLREGMPIEGLTITTSEHRRRLGFFPNGTAPGSNASIHFCDYRGPEQGRRLSISNSGRIRRSEGAANC